LPTPVLAIFYALALIYLFMGIGVVSDIFMDSIGIITSQSVNVDERDEEGNFKGTKKVLVWNSTMANLTLMALGSSAPEILLAIIEASSNLGECPGELGPSTIVGSAAFNLLVISAVSIYAVNAESEGKKDKEDID
jgi:solute carrier family 8 (sodium/calcium exchanger)